MIKQNRIDYLLLTYFGILIVFGLVMLTSASSAVGQQRFGDAYYFIKSQLIKGVLPGIVLFIFFSKFDYHKLKNWVWPIFIGMIFLLILVFVPNIGSTFDTKAHSWIALPWFSFQPSEFAKLGLIIFMSYFLVEKKEKLESFQEGFLPVLIWAAFPLLLVLLQPDLGTLSILFVIFFGILYVADIKWQYLLSLILFSIAGFVVMILLAPYRVNRLMSFLYPEHDPQGVSYHINQAFLAIGSGGLFGRGIGKSLRKFQYLPEVAADSIFPVIAEELGFFFVIGFIILLFLIASRGLMISKKAPDQFGRLLSVGIIIWFVFQSFLNIGAMVGLVPLTGIPLPFVSYGGTSLVVAMTALGILINISKQVKR